MGEGRDPIVTEIISVARKEESRRNLPLLLCTHAHEWDREEGSEREEEKWRKWERKKKEREREEEKQRNRERDVVREGEAITLKMLLISRTLNILLNIKLSF